MYQKIATEDVQQMAQSSFQVIQFIEECDAIIQPPFKDLKNLSHMSTYLIQTEQLTYKLVPPMRQSVEVSQKGSEIPFFREYLGLL